MSARKPVQSVLVLSIGVSPRHRRVSGLTERAVRWPNQQRAKDPTLLKPDAQTSTSNHHSLGKRTSSLTTSTLGPRHSPLLSALDHSPSRVPSSRTAVLTLAAACVTQFLV
ncbi:hypothetical protein VTN96DRAFT_10415 [Rasamsonia emersonii]